MNILKQIEHFKDLFLLYSRYLEVDLANSLINKTRFSRNVQLLQIFKTIFFYSLRPEYIEDSTSKFERLKLQEAIDEYTGEVERKINFNIENKIDTEVIRVHIIGDSLLRRIIIDYYCSDNAFSDAFKSSLINKDEFKDFLPGELRQGEHVFVQALLEFNNAISHLIVACCSNDKDMVKRNVKSAENHLYRATLDNYKIIIRFTIDRVKNNKEDILKSFLSIREQEFLLLGKDLKLKDINFYNSCERKDCKAKIIEAYKTLYKDIVSKS